MISTLSRGWTTHCVRALSQHRCEMHSARFPVPVACLYCVGLFECRLVQRTAGAVQRRIPLQPATPRRPRRSARLMDCQAPLPSVRSALQACCTRAFRHPNRLLDHLQSRCRRLHRRRLSGKRQYRAHRRQLTICGRLRHHPHRPGRKLRVAPLQRTIILMK